MEENRIWGTMKPFRISAATTIASKKIAVIIEGPGIEPDGLRREFSSRTEALDVVDAMNHGFEEGFREGTKAHKTMAAPSLLAPV